MRHGICINNREEDIFLERRQMREHGARECSSRIDPPNRPAFYSLEGFAY